MVIHPLLPQLFRGILQWLLMAGADVTAANSSGATALYRAAQCGHVSVLQRLLSTATASASDQEGAFSEAAVNAGAGSTAGTALHGAVILSQTATAYASECIRPTVGQFVFVSGGGSAPPEPPPRPPRPALHPGGGGGAWQHFPEHRGEAALLAGGLLDMVLEATAAAAADLGAQYTAMQQMLVDAALLQKEQQPEQHEPEQQVTRILQQDSRSEH